MERGRDAQFHALGPQRIVIVGAVDAQHVVPAAEFAAVFVAVTHGRRLARNHAAEQGCLQAQFLHRVFQFLNGFVRCHRWNHRHWRHAVCVVRKVVATEGVERARCLLTHGAVGRYRRRAGGIHHAEIQPQFIHALVEQLRHHGRGAVQRVGHWHRPATGVGDAPAPTFGRPHQQGIADGLTQAGEAIGHLAAGDLTDALLQERPELQPMGVRVDDRMV